MEGYPHLEIRAKLPNIADKEKRGDNE